MFPSCSPLFWVGVALLAIGVAMPFILGRRQPAAAEGGGHQAGSGRTWVVAISVLLFAAGAVIAASTAWQGDCEQTRGACPPAIGGTGYPCKTPGAACKVGWSSGKCTTEADSWWNCVCHCR